MGPDRLVLAADYSAGKKRLALVDAQGNIHWETKIDNIHDVHRLANGNILTQTDWTSVVEFDPDGNVVWEYDAGTKVYSAIRLKDGSTLIGTGSGHSVIEVTPDQRIGWAVRENDLPGCKLAWVTQVARLENGNTIIVNCHAGPDNPQIVEVTPEKKIDWSFKDFDVFGNAMPVAQVLDTEGEIVR